MNKKYSICYNSEIKNSEKIVNRLVDILTLKNITLQVQNIDKLDNSCNFAFVIGGDGTILKAARYFSKYNIPVFGINLGHLGFLSQASEDNLNNAVEQIISGKYNTQKRIMLEAEGNLALNDIVIKGEDLSRASKFLLEIDGKSVCEYYADGLIISTPTGSTAYGMAAGGPVINPNVDILEIVPICPHTFAARPIVVPSDSKIVVKTSDDKKYIASADGQNVFSFKGDIHIQKSKYLALLALLGDNDFYTVLKNKLHWGTSPYKCK